MLPLPTSLPGENLQIKQTNYYCSDNLQIKGILWQLDCMVSLERSASLGALGYEKIRFACERYGLGHIYSCVL